MDLNPTFGHQELLETLSQKSASSTKSSNNNTANNNNNSNSQQVNEAVRRLGYRLSVQAHGGDIRNGAPTTAPQAALWMAQHQQHQQQSPAHMRRALDHSERISGFASFDSREYHPQIRTDGSSGKATERKDK